MNYYLKWTTLMILIIAPFLFIGCGEKGNAQEDPNVKTEKRLTNVKVMIIEAEPFTNYANFLGTVKPNKQVTVSSEGNGRVEKMNVDKGNWVKVGSVIAQLEDDVLQANFKMSRAQHDLAMVHYNSAEELYNKNGGISETEYLTAKYNAEIAEAQKEIAQEQLDNATINSHTTGMVINKMVEEGELVGAGTPIVQILDISKVKIVLGIPENDIKNFQKGTTAEITFDAYPGTVFQGKMQYISPAVDPQSRTFEAEIVINNPDRLIKSEMVAKIRAVKASYEASVIIPQDVVLETENGKAVYVLKDDETVEFRAVKVGPVNEDRIMITEGLTAGEKLIVVGQRNIVDGEKVRVVN